MSSLPTKEPMVKDERDLGRNIFLDPFYCYNCRSSLLKIRKEFQEKTLFSGQSAFICSKEPDEETVHHYWKYSTQNNAKNKFVCVFHHTDLDGDASAALVKNILYDARDDITFCGYNYSSIEPITKIIEDMQTQIKNTKTDDEIVKYAVIVDISFTNDFKGSIFREIIENFDFILWIDHHKSSFNNLEYLRSSLSHEKEVRKSKGSNFSFVGYLDTRVSAAALTWIVLGEKKLFLYPLLKENKNMLGIQVQLKPVSVSQSDSTLTFDLKPNDKIVGLFINNTCMDPSRWSGTSTVTLTLASDKALLSSASATFTLGVIRPNSDDSNGETEQSSQSYDHMVPLLVSAYDTWNKTDMDLYEAGVNLNHYYWNFSMDPTREIWSALLNKEVSTSDPYMILKRILKTGQSFRTLSETKNLLLFNNSIKYSMRTKLLKTEKAGVQFIQDEDILPISVIGLTGPGNSFRFEPAPNFHESICLLINFRTQSMFSLSAYLESSSQVYQITQLDLGKIMQEYFGGGGHPGAAGFSSDYNEFIERTEKIIETYEDTVPVTSQGASYLYEDKVSKIIYTVGNIIIHQMFQ